MSAFERCACLLSIFGFLRPRALANVRGCSRTFRRALELRPGNLLWRDSRPRHNDIFLACIPLLALRPFDDVFGFSDDDTQYARTRFLQMACAAGDLDSLQWMMRRFAFPKSAILHHRCGQPRDFNVPLACAHSPIELACLNNHTLIVGWLINHFALNFHDLCGLGAYTLQIAFDHGHLDIIRECMAVRFHRQELSTFIIRGSCANGHLPVVQWYVEYFRCEAYSVRELLIVSISSGNIMITDWLVSYLKTIGAKANHTDLLVRACSDGGHPDLIRWLAMRIKARGKSLHKLRKSLGLRGALNWLREQNPTLATWLIDYLVLA